MYRLPVQLWLLLSSVYPDSQVHIYEPSTLVQTCWQPPLRVSHSLISIHVVDVHYKSCWLHIV